MPPRTLIHRRAVLGGLLLPALPTVVRGAEKTPGASGLRGSIDASELGVRAGATAAQTTVLQQAIATARDRNRALFLPPGTYRTGALNLPSDTALLGIPGASRLLLTGEGPLLSARQAGNIVIDGVVMDGGAGVIPSQLGGLAQFTDVTGLRLVNSALINSAASGLALTRCDGWIEGNRIEAARDFAIYSLDASGLQIRGNAVARCADGGILVHRSAPGEDGTIVTGNRVSQIGARSGGTGQWGNGINVFRAGNVLIGNNTVRDCAFSAIRSNGGSNIRIVGNSCLRSGETAIYSEFVFQGAVISQNLVDGAAHGISIANFLEGGRMAVCADNIVRNLATVGPYPPDPPGFGIGIWAEADTTVSGNVIEGAPLYGIALGWGPYLRNVVATGNVVRRAGVGIAVSVVEGAGKTVIANNLVAEASGGAIVGFRWAEAVTGDLSLTGAGDWSHLTVSGNS